MEECCLLEDINEVRQNHTELQSNSLECIHDDDPKEREDFHQVNTDSLQNRPGHNELECSSLSILVQNATSDTFQGNCECVSANAVVLPAINYSAVQAINDANSIGPGAPFPPCHAYSKTDPDCRECQPEEVLSTIVQCLSPRIHREKSHESSHDPVKSKISTARHWLDAHTNRDSIASEDKF